MERIVLDTDFETDCDDAGALCVLHTLARRKAAEIAGVVASICSPWPAAGVRALNLLADFPEIPVGSNRDYPNTERYLAHRERTRLYNRALVQACPEAAPERFNPEEGIALYTRLLRQSPDHSVTVCAIGLLTLLAELLRREPELVRCKVKLLVTMANGVWPEGEDTFNWAMDPGAAEFVLANWPSPIRVTPVGGDVLTTFGPNHPAGIAYECWGGVPGYLRPSWDLLAVLSAAGLADQYGYTGRAGRGRVAYDAASGRHRWQAAADGTHECLSLLRSPHETADWVASFMINEPILTTPERIER